MNFDGFFLCGVFIGRILPGLSVWVRIEYASSMFCYWSVTDCVWYVCRIASRTLPMTRPPAQRSAPPVGALPLSIMVPFLASPIFLFL